MKSTSLRSEMDELGAHLTTVAGKDYFDRSRPLLVARAPGRLDVMGGFADYSGSLTLEMPIVEAAWVAVQQRIEPRIRVLSASFGTDAGPLRRAEYSLQDVRENVGTHRAARAHFAADPHRTWVAYVLGALAVLRAERGRDVPGGFDLILASNVPEGKGVSSSAAVEVASLAALARLYGVAFQPTEVALLCQRIENLVVGAPCGVMDQMTSSCGRSGQLLALTCQPAVLEGYVDVPSGLGLWGIDSGLRHQVSGADYGSVRVAAFMGYRMISELRGLPVRAVEPGHVQVEDPHYHGYLANVPPAEFESAFRDLLPEELDGRSFLKDYGGITDAITHVRPDTSYRVRAATAHPIYEHQRAKAYRELMRAAAAAEHLDDVGGQLGELMYAAHESYSACGLGSTGTDRLVELVRSLGPGRGLYGAKITGGGSGGTVAVLSGARAEDAIHEVARRYAEDTGHTPHIFAGSSPGAAEFGVATASHVDGAWQVRRGEGTRL